MSHLEYRKKPELPRAQDTSDEDINSHLEYRKNRPDMRPNPKNSKVPRTGNYAVGRVSHILSMTQMRLELGTAKSMPMRLGSEQN
jgi:hypothetical protein